MSRLQLSAGIPSSKQLIVSDWFRLPAASIAEAAAEFAADKAAYDDVGTPIPLLSGIIPLMILGVPQPKAKQVLFPFKSAGGTFPTRKFRNWSINPVCDWTPSAPDIPSVPILTSQYDFGTEEDDDEPSYIGIDCTGAFPALAFNIQMGTSGTFGGNFPNEILQSAPSELISYTVSGGVGSCPSPPALKMNGHPVPFNNLTFAHTYASGAQFVLGCRKERFRNLPLAPFRTTEGVPVTADTWHHLLWSPDFRNPCITEGLLYAGSPVPPNSEGDRTSSACRLFMALDDVNLIGKDMSVYWPGGYSDLNAILSVNAFNQAGDVTIPISNETHDDDFGNNITNTYTGFSKPTCDYTPEAIPLDHPLGLPATNRWSSRSRDIIRARPYQLFVGQSRDWGIEANRRLFITAAKKPQPSTVAAAALGPPQILFKSSKDWKSGKNTGSLGGTFATTGNISSFSPGPDE